MKKNNILAVTLLGGFVLLAAGCVKEDDMNEKYRPEGTPIVFTAATGYENGDGTRTEYSGDFFDGNTQLGPTDPLSSYNNSWERIDWVNNDPMTIFYKHPDNSSTSANYKVSGSPAADKEISDASIVVDNSQQLVWAGGSGDHIFTAMYPKQGWDGNNDIFFNGTEVRGFIPANQTLRSMNSGSYNGKYLPQMKYAYMVAYKSIPGTSTDHTVDLPFKPAYTAFEFRFRKPANSAPSYKVKSFSMSSSTDDLAGGFSFNITGGDNKGATWGTVGNAANLTRSQSITVSFGAGFTLSDAADLDFTLLALPTDLHNITLTLTYDDGTQAGISKSITLKETVGGVTQNKTFTACKKYIIQNYLAGVGDWVYVLEEVDDMTFYGHGAVSDNYSVVSYKYPQADPTATSPVGWKTQYSTDGGTTWNDVNSTTGQATTDFWLMNGNAQGATGNGSTAGETRTAQIRNTSGYTTESQTELNKAIAELQHGGQDLASSEATAFDLSTHPYYGDNFATTTIARTTANCYVVSRSGWYKFPCVYGNALKNGNTNTSSFDPSAATELSTPRSYVNANTVDVNYAFHFKNALNKNITDPWIVADITAANNNTAPSSLAAKVVWQDTPNNSVILTDDSNNVKYSNGWIYFHIDNNDIKPGNIIIALTGDFGSYTDTIMWSWHIWVTNKDLSPSVTFGNTTMMNVNLGWMDSDNVTKTTYNDRTIKYRIVQNESNNEEPFDVTEYGDYYFSGRNVGTNPYYQWGRKDPIIPAVDEHTDKDVTKGRAGANTSATLVKMKYLPYNVHTAGDINARYAKEGYSTTADYGKGIREPYHPLSNSYTTGWVGGPVIPFWTRNSWYRYIPDGGLGAIYNENQTGTHITNGLNVDNFAWGGWYFRWVGAPGNGPFRSDELANFPNIPASDWYPDVLSDLVNERKDNAICYNLWNAYSYTEANFAGANVYKTVYDPCPVGYTVPSRDTYTVCTVRRNHYPNGASSGTPDGVEFKDGNGEWHFFPFTGGRVWYYVNSTGVADLYDPYHWSHTILLNTELVTTDGFYWTNQHKSIKTDHVGNTNRDNHYTDFQHAYLFLFNATETSEGGAAHYTTGSAGSIRPMVDPNYTPVTQ